MESIYNWIKVPLPPEERPPIYHSKHDPLAPLSSSTFSATRLTKPVGVIGKDLRGTVRPNEYLRAHELTMSCVDVDAAREFQCWQAVLEIDNNQKAGTHAVLLSLLAIPALRGMQPLNSHARWKAESRLCR